MLSPGAFNFSSMGCVQSVPKVRLGGEEIHPEVCNTAKSSNLLFSICGKKPKST